MKKVPTDETKDTIINKIILHSLYEYEDIEDLYLLKKVDLIDLFNHYEKILEKTSIRLEIQDNNPLEQQSVFQTLKINLLYRNILRTTIQLIEQRN